MATEMGGVARLLGATSDERTPLQREVDLIGRALGLAVIAIAAVVIAAVFLTSDLDGASDVVGVLLVGVSLAVAAVRSEEHTSELQSLMRISYAVFCLKQKKQQNFTLHTTYRIAYEIRQCTHK